MQFVSLINNEKAIEWNISLQQAYLFSWIYELHSWADKQVINNEVFYFASKNKAVKDLPILTDKVDTIYRYYKSLEKNGLIIIKKIDGKDYIALTSKGKTWNNKIRHSDINPNELGLESENNSDINPTNITNSNNSNINTDIDIKNKKFNFKKALLDYGFNAEYVDEWLTIRKSKKGVNTKLAFDTFIKQVEQTKADKNEILKLIIEKQWCGFESKWYLERQEKIKEQQISTGFNPKIKSV